MSRRQVIFEWACVQKRPFHSGMVARVFGIPANNASREVLVMQDQGCLVPVGKDRHATLYKANPDRPPLGRGRHAKYKVAKIAVPTGARQWRYVPIECLPLVNV